MLNELMLAKQFLLEGFITNKGFPCIGGNEVDEGLRLRG
jgi:hypothetical protein